MNGTILASFMGIFDKAMADWQMVLFVLLSILLLLVILFKSFKWVYRVLILFSLIVGGVLLGDFISKSVKWNSLEFIDFAIKWGPTIFFSVIVLLSTWLGSIRGLRKSLILLLQATLAGIVWIIMYFVSVRGQKADKILLDAVNLVLGENGLQNMLNVSPEADTLRKVFTEYLPLLFGENSTVGVLIRENTAYLLTLADMAFHIIFAVIYYIFYLLTVFLLYLIYHIFYPVRRYRRKRNKMFLENRTDATFKKKRVGGAIVGLARGFAVALISLSFVGSAFYIVAGGNGSGKTENYDFGKDSTNYGYAIYRSIESYGSQGIFKVLNMMSDPSDSPYYLFAADLVFSGELDDPEGGISENIVFREELGAFSGFARDTFGLLMKYGSDEITPLVNGTATEGAFNTVLEVMKKPEFQTEFDYLIEEFDSKTYIVNLSMSLIDTVAANIDDMSFASSMSADTRELLKIMFRKGYLSEAIPDEREYIGAIGKAEATGSNVRPYLGVRDLITKKDAGLLLKTVLTFLSEKQEQASTLQTVKSILPNLKELSVLKGENKEKLDPAFGRVYCFLENRYLTAEGSAGIRYEDIKDEKIQWTEEIGALVGVAENMLSLYEDIYDPSVSVFEMVVSVFSQENENHDKDVALYDGILEQIADSRLIGKVLSTSKVYKTLSENLKKIYEDLYYPENIVYENTYGEDGRLLSYGEMYEFLYGVRALGMGENNVEFISALMGSETEMTITEMIDRLSEAIIEVDKNGNTLADYLTDSLILRSLMTSALTSYGEGYIYVPQGSLETNGEGRTVNLIEKTEFKLLLNNLSELSRIQTDLAENKYLDTIDDYLNRESFNELLEKSRIFEGTVSLLLMSRLQGKDGSGIQGIVMPKTLTENVELWVTMNGAPGELRTLINALRLLNVNISELIKNTVSKDAMFDAIMNLSGDNADEDRVGEVFDSGILHYTVSKYLLDDSHTLNGLTIIVPASGRQTLNGDNLSVVVKKDELLTVFREISKLGVTNDMNLNKVLVSLAKNRSAVENSKIIAASVVATMREADSGNIEKILELDEKYTSAWSNDALELYNSSNPWQSELPALIQALDEIFGLKNAETFDFTETALTDALSELLRSLNEPSDTDSSLNKLRVTYNSEIVRAKMTKRLDEVFYPDADHAIVGQEVLQEAKESGYYSYDEMLALSEAVNVFGLDLLGLNSTQITDKVKEQLPSLNAPLADYGGRTMLEIAYPSVIISYLMSSEVDKAVGTLADEEVLLAIKSGRVRYSQEELAALTDAVIEMGFDSVDTITAEFDTSEWLKLNENNETKLNIIYRSKVAAAVNTKTVEDAEGTVLKTHPKAYESGIKILRESEIEAIIAVFENVKDAKDYKFDHSKIPQVRQFIYDENGITRSYIFAMTISQKLIEGAAPDAAEKNGLVIPASVVDGQKCIKPEELGYILDCYGYYTEGQEGSIDTWKIDTDNVKLPNDTVKASMFASAVMRATITDSIAGMRKGAAVREERVEFAEDMNGTGIMILSAEELNALSNALTFCGDGTTFAIPDFKITTIMGYDKDTLNELYGSDVIRYQICDCIKKNDTMGIYEFTEEEAYVLDSGAKKTKYVVGIEDLTSVAHS